MGKATAKGAGSRPSAPCLAAITCGLSLVMAGCSSGAVVDDAVGDALESVNFALFEGALLLSNVDSSGLDMTADQAAQAAVKIASKVFQPPGCVTASAEGATTTTKLRLCQGSRVFARMSGTVTVIYAVSIDGLHARLTSEGFRVGRATLDLNAEGAYSLDGERVVLDVTTNASGTGALKRTIARKGSYTMALDPAEHCFDLDGEWETTVGNRSWTTSVTGLHRCAGKCPSTGQITFKGGLEDVAITITYSGDTQASWETSRGDSGVRDFDCEP